MWFHNHYVNRPEDLEHPYVSPLRAESLAGLPRTLLICAEIDPLLDDSIEYARRLEQAGVPVEMRVYPGMFHGFWRMAGVLAEARQALNLAGERMRQVMASWPQFSMDLGAAGREHNASQPSASMVRHYSLLWAAPEWCFHRLARHGEKADDNEAA